MNTSGLTTLSLSEFLEALRHPSALIEIAVALVCLLLAWAAVAFGPVVFARELSVEVFGWPPAFWLASQGALLGFCAIVIVYAWRMRRLDEAGGADEPG